MSLPAQQAYAFATVLARVYPTLPASEVAALTHHAVQIANGLYRYAGKVRRGDPAEMVGLAKEQTALDHRAANLGFRLRAYVTVNFTAQKRVQPALEFTLPGDVKWHL